MWMQSVIRGKDVRCMVCAVGRCGCKGMKDVNEGERIWCMLVHV